MPLPKAPQAASASYPVGPYPLEEGALVGLDEAGRLVPIDRANGLEGVARQAHDGRIAVDRSGTFVFEFRGWAPSFADLGRTVWAFSPSAVAGAPLRTAFEVGRVVGLATAHGGDPGVRVEVQAETP